MAILAMDSTIGFMVVPAQVYTAIYALIGVSLALSMDYMVYFHQLVRTTKLT
jgi:hypothetical protein